MNKFKLFFNRQRVFHTGRLLALLLAAALGTAPLSGYAKQSGEEKQLKRIVSQMNDSISLLREWSAQNKARTDELVSMMKVSQAVAKTNLQRPQAETWRDVERLNVDSLALLGASKSMWEEYGSLNNYLSSFQKAQSWRNCMQQGSSCDHRKMLEKMDEQSIDFAARASQSAEIMTERLNEQIQNLRDLQGEARTSDGVNASLDALSKVNSTTATSLVNLSNQINNLLKLTAHEQAAAHNRTLAEEEGSKKIFSGSDKVSSPHYSVRISDHVR